MASLTPSPKMQFFTANGTPLVGGRLYTYAAGTTTPLATYTDSTGTSANTNPIILDSRGEANVWLGNLLYKFTLNDSVFAHTDCFTSSLKEGIRNDRYCKSPNSRQDC
jgi:hypothetical protein